MMEQSPQIPASEEKATILEHCGTIVLNVISVNIFVSSSTKLLIFTNSQGSVPSTNQASELRFKGLIVIVVLPGFQVCQHHLARTGPTSPGGGDELQPS